MARIRHIALATPDPEATAKFYIEGLGMKQIGVIQSPTDDGYYLTDGYITMAILKFKQDEAATTEGAPKYAGIHHFGYKVEDMASAQAQIEAAGANLLKRSHDAMGRPRTGNVEVKFTGPEGVTIDLSETGWVGVLSADQEHHIEAELQEPRLRAEIAAGG